MAFYSEKYDLFLGSTKSFCHICNDVSSLIEAHTVSKCDEVFIRKFCPTCGESMIKISSDLDYYRLCEEYLKKPDLPETYTSEIRYGCPFDCGVCPQHQNHPCLALFNITDECNMKCNICYYSAYPGAGKHKSMEQIEQMLETLLKVESSPDLIQVTGGEPTTHPQILDILRYLKNSPARHLMLNTNGILISKDDKFTAALKSLGGGFEVYLQFDSLDRVALSLIRSTDMLDTHMRALEALEKYNISTTLVCVIAKGVNDCEVGEIIRFASKYKCVRGVVFQPIQFAGRVDMVASDSRITLSDIRKIIINDPDNPFDSKDMIPLPCDPHKICVGYAAKWIEGDKINIFPVTGKIPKSVLTKHNGTIAFEQDKKFVNEIIETVSLDTAMGTNILKDKVKQKLFCCWPSFFSPSDMGYENVFRIVIMEFSDVFNFDTTNIKRECNFMIEPDAVIPFSTHNMKIKPLS